MNIDKYIAINIFLAVIYIVFHTLGLLNYANVGYLCIIQLVYVIYSWYKIKRAYLDSYIVFTMALYAFNVGQPILESLHLAVEYRNLLNGGYGVDESWYYMGAFFSLISLAALHCGALITQKKRYAINKQPLSDDTFYNQLVVLKRVFISFLIISAPFYLIFLTKSLSNVMVGGYSALYEDGNTKGSFWLLSNFYTPSLIALLFIAEQLRGRFRFVVLGLLLATVVLPPLFLGGRTNMMIIVSIMLLVYFYCNKISLKHILIIAIGGIFVLNIFHSISLNRFETNRSISMSKSDDGDNPAASTISEMGWTMFCTIKTLEYYPNTKDYHYGLSYLGDALVVVPNMGMWEKHPSDKLSSALWLQEKVGFTSGIGYSMPAEAYANFGWFGLVIMVLIGLLYTKMYDRTSSDMVKIDPLMVIIGLIFLWFTISTVRNSLQTFVRALFYYIIPMYLIANYKLKQKCLR